MVASPKSLEQQTLDYLNREGLPTPDDGYYLLLAVSGGVDSVVMTSVLWQLGFHIALAHGNFQLRGSSADADQQLVEGLADALNLTCYTKVFETREYAQHYKISLEMAARELRYDWFRKLLSKQGYHYLATAHHLNDQAETLLLNLTRGTGIRGLKAIRPLNGSTIRPLLFADKDQLIRYAKDHNLNWREDESNQHGTHERNYIRHQVIPALKTLNPSLEQTIGENIQHFREIDQVWERIYRQAWHHLSQVKGECWFISRAGLAELTPLSPYLFAFLSPFGFNKAQIGQIQEALNHQPGALFYAEQYQVEVARDSLIIGPLPLRPQTLTLNTPQSAGNIGGFQFSLYLTEPHAVDLEAPHYACLDADKVSFPLSLRPWQTGDRFYPLGMQEEKKLSDFFIDEHYPRLVKAQTLIMETGTAHIAWIVDSRLDERFKITSKTEKVLVVYYQKAY